MIVKEHAMADFCKIVEIVCKVRHFMHGNMLLSIIHSRLRNKCNDLKIDLFLNHYMTMISTHIVIFLKLQTIMFVHWTIYSNERLQLFRDTRRLHHLTVTSFFLETLLLRIQKTLL